MASMAVKGIVLPTSPMTTMTRDLVDPFSDMSYLAMATQSRLKEVNSDDAVHGSRRTCFRINRMPVEKNMPNRERRRIRRDVTLTRSVHKNKKEGASIRMRPKAGIHRMMVEKRRFSVHRSDPAGPVQQDFPLKIQQVKLICPAVCQAKTNRRLRPHKRVFIQKLRQN